MKELLFRIPNGSKDAIQYLLIGLRQVWSDPNLRFVSEFDSKTGDYNIFLEANHQIGLGILVQIKKGMQPWNAKSSSS